MSRTSTDTGARRPGLKARLFVLGGLGVAALYTAAALGLNAGADLFGPVWVAATCWTVLASLAGALWQGFRHRDWSAFRRYQLPDGRDERLDWDTRSGSYAWMRDWQDRHRHDDHLR